MKKITVTTTIEVYEKIELLPEVWQKLLHQAISALDDAYAPYSNFTVGAAILLENGEIVKGSNQENAAYSLCLCAERVALAAAAARFPAVKIKALAVTVNNLKLEINQPVSPCGACRQVLSEVMDRQGEHIKVLMQGKSGPIYMMESAKDLLPLSFTSDFLGS